MPDTDLKLLEQKVESHSRMLQTTAEQITSLRREIDSLDSRQRTTSLSIEHISETLSRLTDDIKGMDAKMESNIKCIQDSITRSNDRIYQNQIEQLAQYKSTIWTVGGGIIGSVAISGILFFVGLK